MNERMNVYWWMNRWMCTDEWIDECYETIFTSSGMSDGYEKHSNI